MALRRSTTAIRTHCTSWWGQGREAAVRAAAGHRLTAAACGANVAGKRRQRTGRRRHLLGHTGKGGGELVAEIQIRHEAVGCRDERLAPDTEPVRAQELLEPAEWVAVGPVEHQPLIGERGSGRHTVADQSPQLADRYPDLFSVSAHGPTANATRRAKPRPYLRAVRNHKVDQHIFGQGATLDAQPAAPRQFGRQPRRGRIAPRHQPRRTSC